MSNNTVYKETSIGLIPEDWDIERFDNVFELLSTNSFSRDNLIYEETQNQIQNIHYGDIHSKFNNEILDCGIEKLPFIKDDLILNQKFNFLKDGDLIIADASEDYEGVGKCIEVKNIGSKKIVSGLHTFMARDNSGLTANGFRTYIFNNQKVSVELKKIATGTSVYSISKSYLQKLKLPIPPIAEQQKIGEILSKFDEAINTIRQIIEELKVRNKGLGQQLLSGKTRVKGFEETQWQKIKLMELIEFYNKKNIIQDAYEVLTSSKNGLMTQKEYYGGSRITDRENIGFNIIPPNYITYRSRSDDGIFTFNINKYDFTGLVSKYYPVFKSKIGSNIFLVEYLNLHSNFVGSYSVGTSQLVLGIKELSKISLILPSPEEQNAIEKILSYSAEELKQYEQKLETLQLQKKGLMQQLLTGKTRVKI